MWPLFALGAALLASFNPILYKRMLKDAGVVVVVWGVTWHAQPWLGHLSEEVLDLPGYAG